MRHIHVSVEVCSVVGTPSGSRGSLNMALARSSAPGVRGYSPKISFGPPKSLTVVRNRICLFVCLYLFKTAAERRNTDRSSSSHLHFVLLLCRVTMVMTPDEYTWLSAHVPAFRALDQQIESLLRTTAAGFQAAFPAHRITQNEQLFEVGPLCSR